MTPVIEWIADCSAKNLCPFEEFFLIRSIAGDKAFLHTTGAHETPLIMVTSKPQRSDVVKMTILCNFLRADMAVIIQNRHRFRCLVVKLSCSFAM